MENNVMWYLKNLEDGTVYLFSTVDKADEAVKKYACKYYDAVGVFPMENEDYVLRKVEIDPDTNAVFE